METQRTILLVDDDRDFLAAQTAFLSARGYRVQTVESAAEALELLEHAQPDIVFLDLMLEHFDSGFALCHKIRQEPRFEHVPVIMLSGVAAATGQSFAQEAQELKEWGRIDAFLDKPVTGRQILRVIEEQLGVHA